MPAKRRSRGRESQIAFEALAIEGGLLSPEWLSKIGQLSAGAQGEGDYLIPKGLNLRDEIGRYWRIAQAHWTDFNAGRTATSDKGSLSERFVTALLRESFGFGSLAEAFPAVILDRGYPVGWTALGPRVPVIIAPADTGLDGLLPEFGDSGRRRSAFGLAQEYLNAKDDALWGIASDGATLRILRDNASLTRPAWIEVDLARIFTEERYADFAVLWLLLHETRFGREGQPSTDCALESWRNAGREEGTRAREHLRGGVEDAVVALGDGFLTHPENQSLRSNLQDGTLSKKGYFNQLLRLVYRLIFLLTVEERGLLHPDGATDGAKALYAQGYSMRRLRERSVKRNAHDRFLDLWEMAKIVFRGVAAGEPRLGLPALAGIFAQSQCPALDAAKLENRSLLLAVFKLAWLREDGSLARVNWRDMGPEELGSVYESLLELVPQITQDARRFSFATGNETKGNARKTTGSYYTPDSLVQVLLDSALEPVITETIAKNPGKPVDALLSLSIVDPACGSGHFLLAAARRLAAHVARLQAKGTPSASEYRHALRQVVGRCIYGVDLNPMAVELCKVSLWMEAIEPGLPLTFLNSHIQRGNALLGTTPDLMLKGIPDVAWEPIVGDDKKFANALKKRNKAEATGQRRLGFGFAPVIEVESKAVAQAVAELDAASDANSKALANKESQWQRLLDSPEYSHQRFVADAWCAAFVWPKASGDLAEAAPTNEIWRQLGDSAAPVLPMTATTVGQISEHYAFFHWHLQFPQVFEKGGFDVVLGNPPWERVKLQEQEFFSNRDIGIAQAPNASARKTLIAQLRFENSAVWNEWRAASRAAEGDSQFIRRSGRYPLCGKGDVNTYAIFAEHNRFILGMKGRAGFVVPIGIATEDTTKDFFHTITRERELDSLLGFENEELIFPGVHHAFRFALLTVAKGAHQGLPDLVFFARRVGDLSDQARHFSLDAADFSLLNPNTETCPTFRSNRDAEMNLRIYRSVPILSLDANQDGNPWGLTVRTRLWHMAEDSEWFRTSSQLNANGWFQSGDTFYKEGKQYTPLLEAKMIHHFDHRFGTYRGQSDAQRNQGKLPELDDTAHSDPEFLIIPKYWVPNEEVEARLEGIWSHRWLFGWREITGSTVFRTVIASIIPRTAVGHPMPLMFANVEPALILNLYASLCSFVVDYTARQKVGGTHLTYSHLKQLPIYPPGSFDRDSPWRRGTSVHNFLFPRVLELTYTAWDLQSFAQDVGYNGPPFRWNRDRRFLLRCEIDAALFHLYGLSANDLQHVMDSFPIVRKNDEKAHSEYRTKRLILEIYDAMAEAVGTGVSYQTRLDPPPADPRVAHPPRTPEIPMMPSVKPELGDAEDVAAFVLATVHGSSGTISRMNLALAFVLRSRPELLVKSTPPELSERAQNWASKVGSRNVPAGLLVATLQGLAGRHALTLTVDSSSRSVVTLTLQSPAEKLIDPWFIFEARLVLHVLQSQSEAALATIAAAVVGDDSALLTGAS